MCSQRCSEGSTPVCLPKKLSSSAVARPVWVSVPPTKPYLKGFTPSVCSELEPLRERAVRAYSCSSMPGFLGTPIRFPVSQRSKPANSSFGDSDGCVSPSPLIWVISYIGSHFARVSAHSRVERIRRGRS